MSINTVRKYRASFLSLIMAPFYFKQLMGYLDMGVVVEH